MSGDVKIKEILTLRVLRRTPEVSGPRGWLEGAVTHASVEAEWSGGERHLILGIGGESYRFSPETIEAIYDLHQEVRTRTATPSIEGMSNRQLAEALREAEGDGGDVESIVYLENEIAFRLGLPLSQTEQGLTTRAADAITKFCRDAGVE